MFVMRTWTFYASISFVICYNHDTGIMFMYMPLEDP